MKALRATAACMLMIAAVICMIPSMVIGTLAKGLWLVIQHAFDPLIERLVRGARRLAGDPYNPEDLARYKIQPADEEERALVRGYASAHGMHYYEQDDGTMELYAPGDCACSDHHDTRAERAAGLEDVNTRVLADAMQAAEGATMSPKTPCVGCGTPEVQYMQMSHRAAGGVFRDGAYPWFCKPCANDKLRAMTDAELAALFAPYVDRVPASAS